jgi:hypothetical protein
LRVGMRVINNVCSPGWEIADGDEE